MSKFKISREGYLMVDHRASPGLPEEVARESGYDMDAVREGKLFEVATLKCSHCGKITPKSALRGGHAECIKCNFYICDGCAVEAGKPDYVHMPLARFIDISADYAAKTGQPLGSSPSLILPGVQGART